MQTVQATEYEAKRNKKNRIIYEISGEAQICTATSNNNNNNENEGSMVDDGNTKSMDEGEWGAEECRVESLPMVS